MTNYEILCLLVAEGRLYTFGADQHGSLGLGKSGENVGTPTEVSFFSQSNLSVQQVSCGTAHTAVLTSKKIGKILRGIRLIDN